MSSRDALHTEDVKDTENRSSMGPYNAKCVNCQHMYFVLLRISVFVDVFNVFCWWCASQCALFSNMRTFLIWLEYAATP